MTDFRSDTLTKPSAGMRRAMAEAEVGDEQYLEDPTVNRLQELAAELTGKEAALFVPSGTMCNAIAFAVHCRPGDAVILERRAHPNIAEGGGPAIFASVMMRGIEGERGVFTAEQVTPYLSQQGTHTSKTSMVSVENTSNQGGGKIWPLDALAGLRALCDEADMKLHMDGARLMNAAVGSDTPVSVIASYPDSVWIDLSKGLGAPVGAVLAGPADFIEEGRLWKHRLGGAMRQAGIIAAAGIYAFENNVDRLAEDHEHAKFLAEGLGSIPGIELLRTPVETNIVIFSVAQTGMSAAEFARILREEHGVSMSPYVDPLTVRAVTHIDVGREDCVKAIAAVHAVATGVQRPAVLDES
ncbi:MAG: aminotransferase class I/II-fold pyridoxal phosphate-dependent enzyme [Thermomicrobiales bacterium]|nr:aminotransferase class I/II-fold pyridoxal phosphate-dependent enzyme [Thermomicrobiales bacterium]MCO5220930.1 aminotransferase class I/II-fold pyridoxal phosphate-dependent enzyme [Thermomicrobiales bacterium]